MEDKRYGNIYIVTNTINGKQYVGLTTTTIEKRIQKHLNEVKNGENYRCPFHDAIRKYGWENFEVDALYEEIPICILRDTEKSYIKLFNTKIPNGYNLSEGGDGQWGVPMSEEEKEIHRQHLLDPNHPMRTKPGKDNPFFGHKHKESSKQIMREKKLGKKPSNAQKVKHDETGIIYLSLTEAEIKTGYNRKKIAKNCKGLIDNVDNQHFRYVD